MAWRASVSAPSAPRSRRLRQIGEQAPRALLQRQFLAGALDRDHQDRRLLGRVNARAHAHQRTAQLRAEAAQALEPRQAGFRKRMSKSRDLPCGGMIRLEAQGAGFRWRCAVEDCGGDRVGPQDAAAVGAP
jgi:hypothetical protein